MKNLFKGYYKLTIEEIKQIWKDGFISFDTNVLLNLYRYSFETTKEFLNILQEKKDKIWISNQVAYELLINRIGVISDQLKVYDKTIIDIQDLEKSLSTKHKHPHLSNKALIKVQSSFKVCIEDLNTEKKKYSDLLQKDWILDKLTEIFEDKVGSPYTKEQLINLTKICDDRYKNKIPPGYKDDNPDKGNRKYGDFILWSQLKEKSKEMGKPFILVIDDLKEDWWTKINGEKYSARPELLQELYEECNQHFYMYQSARFIEYINKEKEKKVPEKAIQEIKDFQSSKMINFMDDGVLESYLNKWSSGLVKDKLKLMDEESIKAFKLTQEFANASRNEMISDEQLKGMKDLKKNIDDNLRTAVSLGLTFSPQGDK